MNTWMNAIQVHNYVIDNKENYVSRQESILPWEDIIISKSTVQEGISFHNL